ncbi:hypothetical protein A5N15_08840 [Rothia kristinae]|uniref:Acetyl-coenzyme A synthetase N-terminal domain-containing protein n=1 Tax=Rothia kristinae TaxID=37923 RepID=A0A657ITR8_9MICC|nr:hypothetical protein A5N15_08840 [Rothia kristinae]
MTPTYRRTYAESLEDPEGFWLRAAQLIDWEQAPTRALDDSAAPLYRWFPDATLNTCFTRWTGTCATGRGDQVAILHDSPVTGTRTEITYARLQEEVAAFAGALARPGWARGTGC